MPDNDVTVLWKFFGPREGDTMQDFVAEIRELSIEEKKDLADQVRAYQPITPLDS